MQSFIAYTEAGAPVNQSRRGRGQQIHTCTIKMGTVRLRVRGHFDQIKLFMRAAMVAREVAHARI